MNLQSALQLRAKLKLFSQATVSFSVLFTAFTANSFRILYSFHSLFIESAIEASLIFTFTQLSSTRFQF